MSDLTLAVRLWLQGNVAEATRRWSNDIRRFGEESRAHVKRLSHDLEKLNSRWTALASGAGLAVMAKKLMEFEHQMTMIGLNAQLDPAGTKEIQEKIVAAARAKDVKVAPQSIASSVGHVVADTGDMPFAEHNLRNMGLLMRATDATPDDAGGLMSFLQKFKIRQEDEIKKLLDTWLIQGYTGAFTLGDMARGLPIAGGAMAVGKNTDVKAMEDLGVAMQLVRMSVPTSAEAVVSMEQFMKVLSSATKVDGTSKTKGLVEMGLNPYLPGADKPTPAVKDRRGRVITPEKPPTLQWRPLTDILLDAAKLAELHPKEFSKIFAEVESARAVTFLQQEYHKTGRFDTADTLRKVRGDGAQLQKDAARAAGDMSSVVTGLSADLEHAADRFVLPPLKAGIDGYDKLTQDQHDRLIAGGGAGLAAVGLGSAVSKFGPPVLGALGAPVLGGLTAAAGAGLAAYTATGIGVEHYGLLNKTAIPRTGETAGEVIGEFTAQLGATMEQLVQMTTGGRLNARWNRDALESQGMPQITTERGFHNILTNATRMLGAERAPDDASTGQRVVVAIDALLNSLISKSAEAGAQQTQAAATIQEAANSLAAAQVNVTVKVDGPAKVTGLSAFGPVEATATGKAMTLP